MFAQKQPNLIFVFCQEPYSLKWHFWQVFEPTYFGLSARGQTAASVQAAVR